MDETIETLSCAIREGRAILFVGAGVSMSVGLPSWQALIDHMLQELGDDTPEDALPDNSYQTLAEYYRIRKGGLENLAQWMARAWEVGEDAVRQSEIHRLIVSLGFPTIYTTNFDHNLEAAFAVAGAPYCRVIGPGDLAAARAGQTQIIKFHGDFDDPSSLVLTESDYFDRLSFDSPLDMKFRADVLAHPVLFIGYSLSDMNIRLLLHRLWRAWRSAGQEDRRPPSYVFMPRRKPVDEAVLRRWGVTMLSGPDDCEPQAALTDFLRDLCDACGTLSPAASSTNAPWQKGSPSAARAR